jgi:hypothetical protein
MFIYLKLNNHTFYIFLTVSIFLSLYEELYLLLMATLQSVNIGWL